MAHDGTGETMHNLKGAAGETAHCYLPVLEALLAAGETPRLLSVGMGLATIEAAVAAAALQHAGSVDAAARLPWSLESFESEELLREGAELWLEGRASACPPTDPKRTYAFSAHPDPSVPAAMDPGVDVTTAQEASAWFALAAGHFGDEASIRAVLRLWRKNGTWLLSGALASDTLPPQRGAANGVFWDAFSDKTSPELWDAAFLGDFLSGACAERCILATYAAKGILRRALATAGFLCLPRGGFGGKRESTFAVRGLKIE